MRSIDAPAAPARTINRNVGIGARARHALQLDQHPLRSEVKKVPERRGVQLVRAYDNCIKSRPNRRSGPRRPGQE
jgi:hypothetical protein